MISIINSLQVLKQCLGKKSSGGAAEDDPGGDPRIVHHLASVVLLQALLPAIRTWNEARMSPCIPNP